MHFGWRRSVCAALTCAALLGLSGAASAQESVEDLKKTVEDLQRMLQDAMNRLSELEKQQEETAAAVAASPAAERPKDSMDVFWKEGLRLETPANEEGVKPFALKISGRIQNDWFWGDEDDDLETVDSAEDGVEFRRARIAVGGTIYEDFIFNAEYDFAEDAEFKDVYLGAQNIPYAGTARIGHYKEFGSLDELTSDNDTMFLERALPNIFVPSRNVGLGLNNAFLGNEDGENQRLALGIGVFRETDDFGFDSGDGEGMAFTGRATGVPWLSEDGANLVHLGIWGTVRNTEEDDFRIRQRPEIHLAPRFIDTFDDIGEVDGTSAMGGELGLTWGRVSAMGEYIVSWIERPGGEDVMFSGAYGQVGVFLTKDHRGYKYEEGVFDKVKPNKPFKIGKDRKGWGAWEAAVRYSHLDLDDEDVEAGTQDDVTVGVNWFINPNLRWSLNYVHAWVDRDNAIIFLDGTADEETFPPVDGDFDGVVTRFQVTW